MELKAAAHGVLTGLYDWWIDHRWSDFAGAAVVVGCYGAIVWRTSSFDVLAWLPASDRRGVYSAFAVVVSLTGAMSGVAVGQLGSAKGMRAIALKKSGGKELARSWRSIYLGSMGAALLALVALMLDSSATPLPPSWWGPREPVGHNALVAQWLFQFALVFAVLKFARLTALFQPMITAFVRDDVEPTEPPLAPAPSLDIAAFERAQKRTG